MELHWTFWYVKERDCLQMMTLTMMPTTECIPDVSMAPYLGKGHLLCTDNYYTSPPLATYLLANQTHLCVNVRINRKNYPKDLQSEELEKDAAVFYNMLMATQCMLVSTGR